MYIIPTQPQTLWHVIRSGFSLWKSTFRRVWPFSIGFATFGMVFGVIFSELLERLMVTEWFQQYAVHIKPYHVWIAVTFVVILGFLFKVFVNICIIDCIHRSRGQTRNEPVAWKILFKKAWISFMVSLLLMFMYMAVLLLIIIPLILMRASSTFVTCYSMIVLSPFVFISSMMLITYCVFYNNIIIIDNQGIIGSIRAAFKLISNYWWFSTIRFLVIAIIAALFILSVYLVLVLMFAGWYFLAGEGATLHVFETDHWTRLWMFVRPFLMFLKESQHIQDFFMWIHTAFFYPLLGALFLALFYDLRLRKLKYSS